MVIISVSSISSKYSIYSYLETWASRQNFTKLQILVWHFGILFSSEKRIPLPQLDKAMRLNVIMHPKVNTLAEIMWHISDHTRHYKWNKIVFLLVSSLHISQILKTICLMTRLFPVFFEQEDIS